MFSLPSYWSRVCFHAGCNCLMHNACKSALSLSLSPHHPSFLCSEFPLVKRDSWTQCFLKFQIYNTVTIWLHEISSSFQYITLCKWHFFALEISTLDTSIVSVPFLLPEETLQTYWEMLSSNHFLTSCEKGAIVPTWAVQLETWSTLQVGIFSTFWLTSLFYFYFSSFPI